MSKKEEKSKFAMWLCGMVGDIGRRNGEIGGLNKSSGIMLH